MGSSQPTLLAECPWCGRAVSIECSEPRTFDGLIYGWKGPPSVLCPCGARLEVLYTQPSGEPYPTQAAVVNCDPTMDIPPRTKPA